MKLIISGKPYYWLKRNIFYRHEKFDKTLPYDMKNNYSRTAIVNYACCLTKAQSYLEIGCFKNDTFDAVPVVKKIGVDPQRGGTHRMTSDEFFAQNKEKFDVIYIDGLHIYDQVHKDIVNSLKVLNKGGIIVLDDMLPSSWANGEAIRLHRIWQGDCWKCNFEIMATKGLDYKLILCGYGTGVIKPRDGHSPLADLSKEIKDAHFSYLYDNHESIPTIEVLEGLKWMGKNE